jgi:hypothetical protein
VSLKIKQQHCAARPMQKSLPANHGSAVPMNAVQQNHNPRGESAGISQPRISEPLALGKCTGSNGKSFRPSPIE